MDEAIMPYKGEDASMNSSPTARVSGSRAGVDNAWEQKKLEARKMLENAAESPVPSARFVRRLWVAQDSMAEKTRHY